MRFSLLLLSTLAASALAAPSSLLLSNIAYRSPSIEVGGDGLAHDIDAIERRHAKRSENGERGSFAGKLSFPYGVASGDPLEDSVILWTHPEPERDTDQPLCLRWEVSSEPGKWKGRALADHGTVCTTKDVGYSVKVEAKHLKPSKWYSYRFSAVNGDKATSPEGRFKTLPRPNDDIASVNFAVFSCSNLPVGSFAAYGNAAKHKEIDYALHVGIERPFTPSFVSLHLFVVGVGDRDYIYEGSARLGAPEDRQFEPRYEIASLDDYRQRYNAYHRKDASLRAMRAAVAWQVVPDDHEVADNSWKDGSAKQPPGTLFRGVTFSERKRNAFKAYFENMPIRQISTTDDLRTWRQFRIGKLADLNMLDTRQYDRDVTDVYTNTPYIESIRNDTSRSLMGGRQEAWLYNNLEKSKATWKVVAQQILVTQMHQLRKCVGCAQDLNYDAWDGYTANRARFYEAVKKTKNVLMLAGDTHAAWVSEVHEPFTDDYDAATGKGSFGIELGGTAVSSSSSYGSLTKEIYVERAKQLTEVNKGLQFAEGERRGWFSLELTRERAVARFWGNQNTAPDSPEDLLATFEVKEGTDRFVRPINGGKRPIAGALQSLEWDQSSWDGTTFTRPRA